MIDLVFVHGGRSREPNRGDKRNSVLIAAILRHEMRKKRTARARGSSCRRVDQIRRGRAAEVSAVIRGKAHRSSGARSVASQATSVPTGQHALSGASIIERTAASLPARSGITPCEQKQVRFSHGSLGPEGVGSSPGQRSRSGPPASPAQAASLWCSPKAIDARQMIGQAVARKSARYAALACIVVILPELAQASTACRRRHW